MANHGQGVLLTNQRRISMQGGKQPNADQKRWHAWLGSAGYRHFNRPCVLHHCVGSATKHRKRHIGQEFVIPLPPDLHDNTAYSLHKAPKEFARLFKMETRKEVEKFLYYHFATMYGRPQELIDIVMSYSK